MLSLAFLGVASLLAGRCASARSSAERAFSERADRRHVCSFLDVREGRELGAKYMREIEKQLDAALKQRGVRSKQRESFNQAPIHSELALNSEPDGNWRQIGARACAFQCER